MEINSKIGVWAKRLHRLRHCTTGDYRKHMIDPWFLFNWEYDSVEAEVALSGPENRTMAEIYAEARASKLDFMESLLIESINGRLYSF